MEQQVVRKFRDLLEAEQAGLLSTINNNRRAKEELTTLFEKREDEAELGAFFHSKDLVYAQGDEAVVRYINIERAIRRIDRGEYGECNYCGKDIAEGRLEAVPWALLCIGCQEKSEKERGVTQPNISLGVRFDANDEDGHGERKGKSA